MDTAGTSQHEEQENGENSHDKLMQSLDLCLPKAGMLLGLGRLPKERAAFMSFELRDCSIIEKQTKKFTFK